MLYLHLLKYHVAQVSRGCAKDHRVPSRRAFPGEKYGPLSPAASASPNPRRIVE